MSQNLESKNMRMSALTVKEEKSLNISINNGGKVSADLSSDPALKNVKLKLAGKRKRGKSGKPTVLKITKPKPNVT
jgi:hypothetical protein